MRTRRFNEIERRWRLSRLVAGALIVVGAAMWTGPELAAAAPDTKNGNKWKGTTTTTAAPTTTTTRPPTTTTTAKPNPKPTTTTTRPTTTTTRPPTTTTTAKPNPKPTTTTTTAPSATGGNGSGGAGGNGTPPASGPSTGGGTDAGAGDGSGAPATGAAAPGTSVGGATTSGGGSGSSGGTAGAGAGSGSGGSSRRGGGVGTRASTGGGAESVQVPVAPGAGAVDALRGPDTAAQATVRSIQSGQGMPSAGGANLYAQLAAAPLPSDNDDIPSNPYVVFVILSLFGVGVAVTGRIRTPLAGTSVRHRHPMLAG